MKTLKFVILYRKTDKGVFGGEAILPEGEMPEDMRYLLKTAWAVTMGMLSSNEDKSLENTQKFFSKQMNNQTALRKAINTSVKEIGLDIIETFDKEFILITK